MSRPFFDAITEHVAAEHDALLHAPSLAPFYAPEVLRLSSCNAP